jgi:hypothetical protein
MGLAFAFGWTPCIGPVLGAVLGVAAGRETVSAGAMLLAAYSLGLAVPFWIAALFSERFMRFSQKFRRHLGTIEKVTGALLVLTGILFPDRRNGDDGLLAARDVSRAWQDRLSLPAFEKWISAWLRARSQGPVLSAR